MADLAKRYSRKPSTIRGWLERGLFPGAYRLRGRDWRVPASGVEAFGQAERQQDQAGRERPSPRGRTVDLTAWRRVGT
jgi:hypothetical protein